MKPLRSLLLIILLLAGTCNGFSQDDYHVSWYSADSRHLPQNTVKSILADKYGFIWLATENGMVRYDGKRFKVLNLQSIQNAKSDRMNVMGGSIENDSITIRNNIREYFYIRNRKIHRFTSDYENIIDTDYEHVSHNLDIMSNLHYSGFLEVFKVSSGNTSYVIGTDSIRVFDNNWKLKEKFYYANRDSAQYFTTSGKLYRMGSGNAYDEIYKDSIVRKHINISATGKSTIYTNEPTNQVFLVSGQQVYLLKEDGDSFTGKLLYDNFRNEDNIITMFYCNMSNILYMGSYNKGLKVIERKQFKTVSSPHKSVGLIDGVYYALTEYDNKILAATGSVFVNGEYKYNYKSGFVEKSDRFVIITDDYGNIWGKANVYLSQYLAKSDFKERREWKLDDRIVTLYKHTDGKIWIGALNSKYQGRKSIIHSINPAEKNPKPELFVSIPKEIISICQSTPDTLWAGCRDGMYKVALDSKKVTEISAFDGAHIRSLYSPKPDEVWVSTYNNGIYLYKRGKTTHFPVDKNNYLNSAHCIVEDNQGFLWITTNTGLFRVSKQELYDYADGKSEMVYYFHYDKSSGFNTNEFNGGCVPCGVFFKNETIYFPSMNGIVYFNPDELLINRTKSDLYIDEIVVDNTIIDTANLNLNRNFGRVTFTIVSPYFGSRDNLHMQTKLSGPVSQKWTNLSDNQVSFSTLPPGDYKLTTRKIAGFNSGFQYKTITFSVEPAFWETIWFKILVAIVTSLLLLLIFKMRLRYINYKNQELEKQIAERTVQLSNTITTLQKTESELSVQNENHKKLIKTITHDIKSPLKFMAITGRYIYNNFDKHDEDLKDDIQAMHTSSSQLYHFVDQFLEYTKETDSEAQHAYYILRDLIKEKINLFKNIAGANNTSIFNEVDKSITINANRHLLSIILHNLLDNAVKCTDRGTITFNANKNEHYTTISVKDTGQGMSPKNADHYNKMLSGAETDSDTDKSGMGLVIVAGLITNLNAKVYIDTELSVGTEITIQIPK